MNFAKPLLIAILISTIAGLLGTPLSLGQTSGSARLRGTVRDSSGAVVPCATVTFTAGSNVFSVKADEDGTYSIDLNHGRYKPSASSPLGFEVTYRAPIVVRTGTSRFLNFVLFSKFEILTERQPESGEPSDHPSVRSYGLRYESLPFGSVDDLNSVVIRYASKCETGPLLTYASAPSKGHLPVGLTYDFFSVSAEKIHVDLETREIYALGDMIIDFGDSIEAYSGTLRISIENGKITYKKNKSAK